MCSHPMHFDLFQNVKLASSIEELTDKLGTKVLVSDLSTLLIDQLIPRNYFLRIFSPFQEISQQLLLERRAKKKNINAFSKLADMDNKKGNVVITLFNRCQTGSKV